MRASLSCWELEIHKGGARKNVALVSFSGKDTGCPIAFRPGRNRDQGRGRTRRRVECNRLGGGWSWGRGIRGDRSWRGVDPCGVRLVGLGRAEGVRHPANQYLGRGWPLASVSVSFVVVGVASLRQWRGWIERWRRGGNPGKSWRWRGIEGGGRRARMGKTLPRPVAPNLAKRSESSILADAGIVLLIMAGLAPVVVMARTPCFQERPSGKKSQDNGPSRDFKARTRRISS